MNFTSVTLSQKETLAVTGGRRERRRRPSRDKVIEKLTDAGFTVPEDPTRQDLKALIKEYRASLEEVDG